MTIILNLLDPFLRYDVVSKINVTQIIDVFLFLSRVSILTTITLSLHVIIQLLYDTLYLRKNT